jgi:arylsulfatase A-like enzyme
MSLIEFYRFPPNNSFVWTITMVFMMAFSGFSCNGPSEKQKAAKDGGDFQSPNVLIISVDDLKDWVGHLNGYEGKVFTPNIDRLASEGMAFTNAQTAAPQCGPSRNAIWTGKYPSTTGLYGNNMWWKPNYPNLLTLPGYFKNHGYYAAGAGKVFHHTPGNNAPCSWNEFQDQVFDDPWRHADWKPSKYFLEFGFRDSITPLPSWNPMNGIDNIRIPMDWGSIPGKRERDYGDHQVVNYARDFLQKKQDKPFFLALGIYKPHIPWYVPQKYFDMYPLEEVVLPKTIKNDLNDLPEEGKKQAKKNSKDYKKIKEAGKYKEAVQAYLACISFADALVGDILNALENSEYSDNTIVVLWSDHGWHLGSKQTWHKHTLWEEATHIPFIIKAPGITQSGNICDAPVDMVNVYPTLISLCDLPPKEDLDGRDMTRLLRDPDMDWEWPAITEYDRGEIAVRTEKWRYIRYSDGSEELYNRDNDPYEWDNLANDNQYNEILEKHRKWIPDSFSEPALKKDAWFFDPYSNTYMNRETGEFIDGKK